MTDSTSPAVPPRPPRVPVTIVTGYLGAGKTSLVNHLLRAEHGLRIGVIVNDFGAVNIDADLIENAEAGIAQLTNGCLCCTIRTEVLDAIDRLLAHTPRPDHLVIEASGVASPDGILVPLLSPMGRQLVRVNAVVTVVDTEQYSRASALDSVLLLTQTASADIVVLNKVDLTPREVLAAVKHAILTITPRARIVETTEGAVSPAFILADGAFDPERLAALAAAAPDAPTPVAVHTDTHAHHADHHADHHHHAHGTHDYESWSHVSNESLSLERVVRMLEDLPVNVFRGKGILRTADEPDRQVIVHLVGSRVSFRRGRPWDTSARQTRLVLVGKRGAIDHHALDTLVARCRAMTLDGAEAS